MIYYIVNIFLYNLVYPNTLVPNGFSRTNEKYGLARHLITHGIKDSFHTKRVDPETTGLLTTGLTRRDCVFKLGVDRIIKRTTAQIRFTVTNRSVTNTFL